MSPISPWQTSSLITNKWHLPYWVCLSKFLTNQESQVQWTEIQLNQFDKKTDLWLT